MPPLLGAIAAGVVVVVGAFALTRNARSGLAVMPLAHWALRVNTFASAAALGAVPNVAGLWVIGSRARSIPGGQDSSRRLPGTLSQYLIFRSQSYQFLAMLSALIATAVFQTSALRNALVGSGLVKANRYPPEFVLLYGAFFALAIAVAYIPPELELRQAGRTLQNMAVDQLMKKSTDQPTASVGNWLERAAKQDQIGQVLGLNVPVLARLQTSLGILAPLLVSLVAILLPH